MSYHGLDVVAPSAALLAVEDDIGNRAYPNSVYRKPRKQRPNQVVALINALAELMTPKQNQRSKQ